MEKGGAVMGRELRSVFIAAVSALALGGCSLDRMWGGAAVGTAEDGNRGTWEGEFNRGKESLASGYLGHALERFKSALGMNPQSARVMNALAVTYDRLGRHDLAQLYYDRALMIEPNSATTLNNLGYSMLSRERYEEALIYFDRALKQQQVPVERQMTTANRELALERLRLARQQQEKHEIAKAALADSNVTERLDCSKQWPSAVGRTGTRVFSLITSPSETVAWPTNDSLRSAGLTAGAGHFGQDCASSPRRRVAMLNTTANEASAEMAVALKSGIRAVDEAAAREVALGPAETVGRSPAEAAKSVFASASPVQAAVNTPRSDRAGMPATLLKIEVSNGAGRSKLAARTRAFLESKGLKVSYLTNAARFDNRHTTVFYKRGQRTTAESYAKQLPITVEFVEVDNVFADIRIQLGADILKFDGRNFDVATIGAPNV
jgi:Tfp pilus assembly protein PilF